MEENKNYRKVYEEFKAKMEKDEEEEKYQKWLECEKLREKNERRGKIKESYGNFEIVYILLFISLSLFFVAFTVFQIYTFYVFICDFNTNDCDIDIDDNLHYKFYLIGISMFISFFISDYLHSKFIMRFYPLLYEFYC